MVAWRYKCVTEGDEVMETGRRTANSLKNDLERSTHLSSVIKIIIIIIVIIIFSSNSSFCGQAVKSHLPSVICDNGKAHSCSGICVRCR